MRMAEESEAQVQMLAQEEAASVIAPPPAAIEAPSGSGSLGVPEQPPLSASDSAGAAAEQASGGYIDPIAPQDLPNAMMEALARYEAMSQ